MIDPEPSLIPPDDPPEIPWTDWSVPAWISVNARTAEEAEERVAKALLDINEVLRDGIVQLQSDKLPELA